MKKFAKTLSHRSALFLYSLVTLVLFNPVVAQAAPTSIDGAVNGGVQLADQIGKYLGMLFTAYFAVILAVRLWGYTHAPDDSDLKQAKKKILHSVIGAGGFLCATLVLAFIKQYI